MMNCVAAFPDGTLSLINATKYLNGLARISLDADNTNTIFHACIASHLDLTCAFSVSLRSIHGIRGQVNT
jgi:hypothetical protein